jgi:hypothetical protein
MIGRLIVIEIELPPLREVRRIEVGKYALGDASPFNLRFEKIDGVEVRSPDPVAIEGNTFDARA